MFEVLLIGSGNGEKTLDRYTAKEMSGARVEGLVL